MRQFSGLRGLSGATGFLLLGLIAAPLGADELGVAIPSDRAEIVHVLNRITFGPRPGDVEMVERMGLQNYIEQQLHPETIDDSAVDQKLQGFVTLNLSARELSALYRAQLKKGLQKALEAKPDGQAAGQAPAAGPAADGGDMQRQMALERLQNSNPYEGAIPYDATPEQRQAIIDKLSHIRKSPISELADAKLIRATDSNRQLYEVLVDFWSNHFNIDMRKGPCKVLKVVDDREAIRPHVLGKFRDLLEASAKSPAMLYYLDNALNTVGRAASAPVAGSTEMQMAEENKLLETNVTPFGKHRKTGGINENYGREIMELHTLGVDGGYTQADVQEVARCFTGWGIDRRTGEFRFNPREHDNGSKTVLGHFIPAGGGMQDGETVLDILASSPATAHFISRELCQRFISDNPPESAVQRAATVFQQTDGDLRQVVQSILTSPEFLSPSCFGAKIKSPLEFTVSAVRATGSTIEPPSASFGDAVRPMLENAVMSGRMKDPERFTALEKRQTLNYHIYSLGEPLFDCIPPTGYKEVSSIWVSPGALIERLNFAMALTEQDVSDVRFDAGGIIGSADLDQPQSVLEQCISTLLPGGISNATRNVLVSAAVPATGDNKTIDPAKLIALVLGSPEFQRK